VYWPVVSIASEERRQGPPLARQASSSILQK
jgi:hypothetical protein